VPRVRTLLVCDLADSTALLERLGDSAAADLIRQHDRVARDLLHRHGGREIDKTDGFLALFERPVEAVAFALDYQRALRTLSDERRQRLRARVGIHIGEVVLWENAAGDIADGAKPVDVEGLAKPVAARLMALALPGQVLLSGIAFSLAQRAASELPGREVRWLTHGRYRFKGVPSPMLVHEVGETGLAPLHAPPSTAKAERDVPLWRKPGVLTLEAILIAIAIAVPIALTLRAPPAIAFGERDWVVVGDRATSPAKARSTIRSKPPSASAWSSRATSTCCPTSNCATRSRACSARPRPTSTAPWRARSRCAKARAPSSCRPWPKSAAACA
jgi:putative peptide modification system cyclase